MTASFLHLGIHEELANPLADLDESEDTTKGIVQQLRELYASPGLTYDSEHTRVPQL